MVRPYVLVAALVLLACDGGTSPPAGPEGSADGESASPSQVPGPASPPAPSADPKPAPPGPPGDGPLPGAVCDTNQGMPNPVAGIQPARAVDGVELRRVSAGDQGPVGEATAQAGTPCKTAKDRAACESRFEQALSDQGFGFGCRPLQCHEVLVWTHGDEVGVVDTVDGLKEFLGPIDTRGEALLVLRAHRYQVGPCQELTDAKLRKTDTGFAARVSRRIADCPVQYADYELAIRSSGDVSVVSEKIRPLGKQQMCI